MKIEDAIQLSTGGIGGYHIFNPPLFVHYVRPPAQGRPVAAEVIAVATHQYSVIPERAGKFEIRIAGRANTVWVEPRKIIFTPPK